MGEKDPFLQEHCARWKVQDPFLLPDVGTKVGIGDTRLFPQLAARRFFITLAILDASAGRDPEGGYLWAIVVNDILIIDVQKEDALLLINQENTGTAADGVCRHGLLSFGSIAP